MIFCTIKLTKKKIAAITIGAFLVISLFALSFPLAGATETGASMNNTTVKTNEDRIAYLKNLGWEVVAEPIAVREVIVPTEFDQVYKNYNEIQKTQGFDLEKFLGRRIKRYTYKVTNYEPKTSDEINANIYIYNNKVIAGDICSTALDGFMKNLIKEKAEDQIENKDNKTGKKNATETSKDAQS